MPTRHGSRTFATVAVMLGAMGCGLANGEECREGRECRSDYCIFPTPDQDLGICEEPPDVCEDTVSCNCPFIGDSCNEGGYGCVEADDGVTIRCP